jgi:NAD(P)-dependent dehydrogenase (short-subunit alcohol dehydrogenase family)
MTHVAIVTGGGRGIGRAAAEALASSGAAVTVVARSAEQVRETAALIEDGGGRALARPADITEPGAASQIATATRARFGRPCDILVNAAGLSGPVEELAEFDLPTWRAVIDVNLTGAFAMCRAVLPAMRENRWGRIVNVISGHARRVQPGVGPYAASKAALLHLSRVMDAENRARGVRVFPLEPGVVQTGMLAAQPRAASEPGVRGAVARSLREIEAGRGFVQPEESARLIRLVATGEADELAGEAFSIYDEGIRERLSR